MVLELKTYLAKEWKGYKARPFLISGPCSAETEEQVMATATQLAQIKEVSVFRAGIWKPVPSHLRWVRRLMVKQ
jgi:3-deoxy-D-arabino-heptulosonate 7-phosphate (DAHP) synthase